MNDDSFWALIADSRQESGDNTELVSRVLFRRLRALDATEVVEFVLLWERARSRLYSWPVTNAACLLLGPVEEEDLCHIQDWIISYDHPAVERIAREPDSLADLAADAATLARNGSASSSLRRISSSAAPGRSAATLTGRRIWSDNASISATRLRSRGSSPDWPRTGVSTPNSVTPTFADPD